jgi:Na+-transporting NADH:ubiquinone oxidoreductase subunit NqrB
MVSILRLRSPRLSPPRLDARVYQILFLGLLLMIGALLRDFSIRPEQIGLTFAAGLLTQTFWIRRLRLVHVNHMSAIITCFSLSLLLRADSLWVHPSAAILALSSKFVLRVRGKHVFNPGNLGVILAVVAFPGTWVSAGQWGQDVALAGWFTALGTVVVLKARRVDVSWAFLTFFLGLIALRVLWLGQRPAVLLHQLQNGSILLFAFFMISDPMTIPNRVRGRILYAALVAGFAFLWQYHLYRTNALLWSLFLLSPLVPLLDALWPASRFEWLPKGVHHDPKSAIIAPVEVVVPSGATAMPPCPASSDPRPRFFLGSLCASRE